ncbi:MAG: PAS domain-containing protein [Plectolyngbya sp. WJT66-NPBG17]|jgi:PAS domain S-box-containing protein|nr:PAS domain-containing protein [Plectolyngbya sp. WJT66-NPBG17]
MFPESSLKILIVSDDEFDRHYLSDDQFVILDATSASDALRICRTESIDLILLNSLFLGSSELSLIAEIKTTFGSSSPPILVMTSEESESIAVQALEQGAEDYLIRSQVTASRLNCVVRKAIENAHLKRELAQTQQALHESQRYSQRLTEAIPGILYIYDLVENCNVYTNCRVTDLLGYTPEQVREMGSDILPKLIHPEDLDRVPLHFSQFQTARDDQMFEFEYRMRNAQGEWCWLHTQEVVFRRSTDDGTPDQILGIAQQVMQRKMAELSLARSNERFELAADAINSLIYELDLTTGWVERTRGLVNVVGYLPEEAEPTAQWWQDLIHPDDLNSTTLNELIEQVKHLDRYKGEYRVRHKDGHYVWVQEQGIIVRDGARQPIRIIGNTNDISQRRAAEQALRESEAKFRRLADSNLIGIFFADFTGRIYEANDAFLDLLGYTHEELEAGILNWQTMTPPGYEAQAQEVEAQLRASGIAVPSEKEYFHKDGSRVPILIGTAILEGHERDGYSICFVMDLRDRKRALQEREKLLIEAQTARAEAESINRSKDEFLAVVSHELRSPLNSILGWAKLLQARTYDPETVSRALSTIERNAQAQSQLIEDLLDVSRMIHGNLRITLAPVHLAPIVEIAIANVQLAADAKEIIVRSQIEQSINLVLGDPHRLQQVITNLLTNAVKFTPNGGRVHVMLGIAIDDSSIVEIAVRDTGKGIDAEFLPHVFDRFTQAESDSSRSKDGLGLGLAISRHLVELHQGTIRAESPGTNQGAVFTVRLPLILD